LGAARPFPKTRFGAYELLAPLAVGGTAEIFLARWRAAGHERLVVVKQLLPQHADDKEFVDMFLDEARFGSKLAHESIAQTFELGQVGGRHFIAMEYLAGLTLGHLAAKARRRLPGGLPAELAAGIVAHAARGLHHAHEILEPDGTPLKIVHRDVSPQNLIVTFAGEVKLVDFGIAHAAVREARTKTGMIKGKFAYMAPEQCLGKPVDRRTDVFALGVVLYECVTGQRLFRRKSSYETYQAILKHEVPAPTQVNPALDPDLEPLLLRALVRDPDGRYPTAAAFADALEAWIAARGAQAGAEALRTFYLRVFSDEVEQHRARIAQILAGASVEPVADPWDQEEPSPPREAATRELRVGAPKVGAAVLAPHDVTTYAAPPDEKTALAPVPLPEVPEAAPFLVVPGARRRGRAALWIVAAVVAGAVVVVVRALFG
jgi:serine/threonine protein kinase